MVKAVNLRYSSQGGYMQQDASPPLGQVRGRFGMYGAGGPNERIYSSMLDLRQMETNPLSRFDSSDARGNWSFGSRYNLAPGGRSAMGERVFSMEALNNPHSRRSTARAFDFPADD